MGFVGWIILFQSCQQKLCPAFESYYLLDEEAQEKQFTYFGEDSLPRTDMREVNKNRFGIIQEPVTNKIPYPIRSVYAKLNTLEPEIIYPQEPDTVEFTGDELMFAEMDIPDSAMVEADSVEGKIWHFNVDQDNYFKYLVQRLNIKIEFTDEMEDEADLDAETDATDIEEEKKGGFFKNLFKKKKDKKSETETEAVQEGEQKQPQDETDFSTPVLDEDDSDEDDNDGNDDDENN